MANDATKLPAMITPVGIASTVYLLQKDEKFGDVYKIQLLLDKRDIGPGRVEWGKEAMPGAAWVKNLQTIAKDIGAEHRIHHDGFHIKDGDKPNGAGKTHEALKGKLVLNFKSTFKPKSIDTKQNELPRSVRIENGDTVKVLFRPTYGKKADGSVYFSWYLNEVMLVEKTATGGADWGDDSDGYVVPDDQQAVDYGDDTAGVDEEDEGFF